MSALPATQLAAGFAPHYPHNRGNESIPPPETALSDTSSSEDWALAPSNISGRLDQLQNTVQDFLAQVNHTIAQVNQNIAQVNQNISTGNANIALNTNQILQITQQISHNSSNITQMKQDIAQLVVNTTLIAQLCGGIVKKVNHLDTNTQARIANSHAKSPTDSLRPLLNTSDVSCEKFPSTLAELDELDDETIVNLLQQLGLAIGGNTSMQKRHLSGHIGVLSL